MRCIFFLSRLFNLLILITTMLTAFAHSPANADENDNDPQNSQHVAIYVLFNDYVVLRDESQQII